MRLIDADAIEWEEIEHAYGRRNEAVTACECLIDEQPTIGEATESMIQQAYEEGKTIGEHSALTVMKSLFHTEPKKGEWIPCSERLPERTDKYLVTVENGNVYAGTFSTFDNKFTCKAVAWMELPEPYKDNND